MPVDREKNDALREFHIAGVVVYARIESLKQVARALETLPGAQVHGASTDGKLVLTLESDRASHVAELLGAVQAVPDVLSTALVYQHHEHLDSLHEDDFDDSDASRVH